MQLEIFVARHDPFTADVAIIERHPADIDLLGRPIHTRDHFPFVDLRPDNGVIYECAWQTLAAGVIPTDDDRGRFDAAALGLTQQVLIQPPAGRVADDQVGLVALEQIIVNMGCEQNLQSMPEEQTGQPRTAQQADQRAQER